MRFALLNKNIMDIKQQYISYQEIKDGVSIECDNYGLAAYLGESRKEAFFHNPNLTNLSDCLLALVRVDGVVVGREMLFPSKVRAYDTESYAQSCSALDVDERFQHLAIGSDLFRYYTKVTDYPFVICSGISDQALPLYKVWRYHVLEFPRYMLLCRANSILNSLGLKGVVLKTFSLIPNVGIKLWSFVNSVRIKSKFKKFKLSKENIVPDWVDTITLDGKYKYMEIHDKEWLQWCLDYNFRNEPRNIQSFYSIYQNNKPVGFFMTKERFRESAGGKLKNILLGAIVEWGTFDDSILSEDNIYKLALSTFSKNIDIIELASSNLNIGKKLRTFGFIKHGFAHIAFKDKSKKYIDASDINLWRIRYGYADVILT